jgi:hypothetical protein
MLDFFPKLIELDELSRYGEPTIQLVQAHEYNRLYHVKAASEALDYIKSVKPQAGRTIILVLAMTAGEFYGPNRNGDAWPERPLQVAQTKIDESQVLPVHYKSFETDANIFQHHVNKDPEKRIGDVVRAFYNWPMHRVELLLSLINDKAQDIVERIEKGEFPAVSMGCFTTGTLVTLGDGTRKPIENIQVGDLVLTHKGNAKKVTAVHKRPYRGDLYSIKPAVYPEIQCTEEHPFWVSSREQLRVKNSKAVFRWNADATPEPDWTHAKCLDEQHLMFEPVITDTVTPDFVTRPFARLFGYYLAEGMVLRNEKKDIVAIQLHVNKHDPVLDEIEQLCTAFGTRNPPNIYPRPHCDAALAIDIWDTELAVWCHEHGGSYGRHKKLSFSAMRWNPEMQREMLGAYANGDGHGTKNGALTLSTASPNLAWQLVAVCHRLGITPSIQNLEHKVGSGFTTDRNTYEWVVHIGKQWAQKLHDVCSKVVHAEIKAHRNDRYFYNNQIATPIRNITVEHVECDVHNIEVEDDESYVAGGVSVHNCKVKYDVCSICGNRARNRREYCDDAKYRLGDFLPNGKRVFVWNPSPRFFDISMVRRPADKLGYMMKKVAEAVPDIRSSALLGEYVENASRKVAGLHKLSIIHKILRGVVGAAKDEDGRLQQFGTNLARPMAEKMPPLDDETIRSLLKYRPAQVLATLSSMGILLTTPEFIKFFIWKIDPSIDIPEDILDRAVAAQQQVFETLANNPKLLDDIDGTEFVDTAEENRDPELARKLEPLAEKRSQAERNLYRLALRKSAGVQRQLPFHERPYTYRSRTTNELSKLAGAGAMLSAAYGLLGNREMSDVVLRPFDDSPSGYGDFTYKVSSFEGLDEANAMLRMAMDFAHRRAARSLKLASLPATFPDALSFDEAATRIGRLICPSN